MSTHLTAMQLTMIVANLHKPEDVRFDGVQEGPDGDALQFTDLIKGGPSHGATFYLPIENATAGALRLAIAKKRAEFAPEPARIRPCFQRAPRQFAGPEQTHK